MTRLSSRLTVSALALVALAAVFGLCAPRPRAARTVVRVGSQRAGSQTGGGFAADDHQADAAAPADEVTAGGSVIDGHGAAPHSAVGQPVLLFPAPVLPGLSATGRVHTPAQAVARARVVGPALGRAPPTV
jgi:hypothetical protein